MYNNAYSQYPKQQQPPMNNYSAYMQQPMVYGLKGRPVASIEEARASSIDFDGSVFFFPDLANRRIYTKQINLDGTASLNVYELKEIPIETNNTGNYITREEFENTLLQLRNQLNQVFMMPPQQAPQFQTQQEPQKEDVKTF